jgi:ribosome-binding protein aMBF1 (putative translation factor)
MIRTDREYEDTKRSLANAAAALAEEEKKLIGEGLSAAEARQAMAPSWFFREQLQSEVASFERLKRGEFDELHNLDGLGQMLIGLRVAAGISQRDLADRLGVHESMVSRDERNEYHGVTVDRANRILEALGAQIVTHVKAVADLAKSA